MISELLLGSSAGILGVFLGAQLTEAVLFVPYWKALSADDFFDFYQNYGKKIHQFFAPLTIAATLIPLLSVAYHLIDQTASPLLLGILGVSTLAFFSTYFLYFKEANQQFAQRSLSTEAVPKALARWGKWHWGRVGFECLALMAALLLVA